jgi:hypothetical protein
MSIVAFFQQSAGRWSSIKSNHHVTTTQQQSGRSTITMALLETNDPIVLTLCEKQGIKLDTVTTAAQVSWDGTMEGTTKNDVGAIVLVAVGSAESGTLFQAVGKFGVPAPAGRYTFGAGGEFILTRDDPQQNITTIERVWYESENVRLRHNKIQHPDGKSVVSFCSEVRLLSPAPAK